ncbi:helix-turn-helix transcriptional regulator [Ferruginivarius sediminum]|uniref:DNA-binding response regulator n=1 Tax=Ferruginivarius sediminum TaxID=2661937 RepID=A0A369T7L2_9PROT|nr:LuxR C-terminal-related transcriptional regulator [Ferruginivarius sediminum]RDD61313.1 DNA-binding response regulator [Ferruginivarius sediminum]
MRKVIAYRNTAQPDGGSPRHRTSPAERAKPNGSEGKGRIEVLLVSQSHEEAQRLTRAIESDGSCEIVGRPELHTLAYAARVRGDVVVVEHSALVNIDINQFVLVSRRLPVVVALTRGTLLGVAEVVALSDGLLFTDYNLDMACKILALARRGYCLLPRFLGTEHVIDELRLSCLAQLNEQDTRVLEKLGRGLSNKTIATELGVSEAAVKALVRSILQKLHLHNRTEAGVFYIRHEDRIGEIAPHL